MNKLILTLTIILSLFLTKIGFSQEAIIHIDKTSYLNTEQIFDIIRINTDYQFVYRYDLVKGADKIEVKEGIIKAKDLLHNALKSISCAYDFDDQKTIVVRKKKKGDDQLKTISGIVQHKGTPVSDVHISIKGKQLGTKTNSEGYYQLKAEIGDIIRYSHLSFSPVSIIVEDVTHTLNIEMKDHPNKLDEVTIKAHLKELNTYREPKHDKKIKTALFNINPMLLNGTQYFPASKIQKQYRTLSDGLKFYYPKGIPTDFYDIDGVLHYGEPYVDLSTVLYIYFYPGNPSSANFKEALMIVRTTNSKEYKEEVAEQHRNQNYYNEDAIEDVNTKITFDNSELSQKTLRTITGKITHLDAPLPDVNIKVKGRIRGTKTNSKGEYQLKAKTGEIIEYSYVGFKSVSIIVEDITEEIHIDMITEVNELDEVIVTVKTIEGNVLKRSKKADQKFNTSRGNFDPKTSGYAIGFIDGDEVSNTYSSIKDALVGKIAGYSVDGIGGKAYLRGKNSSVTQDYPVAWEVDGNFTTEEPLGLDLSQIENVYALKSLAATNKYGTLGAGGVIVITTKYGNFQPVNRDRQKTIAKHQNNNFYNNDAKQFNLEPSKNQHVNIITSLNDLQEAYRYYTNDVKYKINDLHAELPIAQTFISHYKNRNLSIQILKDLAKKYRSHPELLKAIAYQMQIVGARGDAVKVYQEIYKLRPKYAQSYRDLANAYHENDQYKKSWRLYMSYLLQGHDVTNEGIGSIIYNEMEYLYFNRQYQTKIKEKFIPKNEHVDDFRNDVRMVFEWNTSEAEFDLEFVSPDKRSYIFEHSLTSNEALIIDEKTKGYSSKEFSIEAVGNGEWLVNINYNGNKKPEPTYFKLTTYYHWGKTNQRKDIQIFKFQNQRDKIQLVKINKQSLLVSK